MFRKLLDDICSTIEDLFITFLGFTLVVFMAGQFYGVEYAGSEEFWYPVWAFLAILAIKILKDFFSRTKE